MNLGHTLGFCLLGLGMFFLPALAPGFFPPDATAGCCPSILWLRFMGWVNGACGSGLLLWHHALPRAAQVLAWRPAAPAELSPGELLRPALAICRDLEGSERDREPSAA